MLKPIERFLGFLMVALFFCTATPGETPPQRPAAVPVEALWIGGPDGGVFVTLQAKSTTRGVYFAKVYADWTGEVLYQGRLILVPAQPALASIQDPALFVAWDGSALLLADGRRMVLSK